MSETIQEKTELPIKLDFESVRKVVVKDGHTGDQFYTTVKEAAHACRRSLEDQDFQSEFESFLAHINEWCHKHADVVAAAYVGVSSEGLTGVIVTKGEDYRFDFDDEVTRLDIELAKLYPNCKADVLPTPEGAPDTRIPYIALERAVQVYGNSA